MSFILTSLIVVIIPGTGVIYTVSTALAGNRRQSIIAALGCTLGIVPHLAAGILGISALLHTSAYVFRIVRIVGVLYLVYLGYGMMVSKTRIELDGNDPGEGDLKIIARGILLNLLNPKLTLFFLSFLPQFMVDSGIPASAQMTLLSLIFMGLTLAVFLLYGILANSFKRWILSSKDISRRIQQSFGLVLIGFAAKLALSEE